MIPKIVHYIWFGPKPFPDKVKECIASWHKHLPEYKLMLWNEQTFDITSACDFVREAYENKKYAFVSDYVRLWALKKYGGVYLDTDIEILKPIDEKFLTHRVALGTDGGGYLTALMMAEPEHPYISQSLEVYHKMKFVQENGQLNMEVNNTSLQEQLKDYGYKIENKRQSLSEGIEVYPDDYFHVRSLTSGKLNLTTRSVAIHWHTITWVSPKTRFINYVRVNVVVPLLGTKLYSTLTNRLKNGKTSI